MPTGFDFTIEFPTDALPGDRYELQARHGVLDQVGGGLCGVLSGRTMRGSEASEWASIAQPDACVPVPESGLVVLVAVGAVWLVALAILGPVIGRMLRRNAQRYPAPDVETPRVD